MPPPLRIWLTGRPSGSQPGVDPARISRVLENDGLSFTLECIDPMQPPRNAGAAGMADIVLIDGPGDGVPQANPRDATIQARRVMLADRDDDAAAIAAVKAGAFDYVHRDTLARLPIVVRRAADDITAERRIAVLARTDALTGLANRAAFAERAAHSAALARREGGGFAMLYLDLDNFKDVNDTLGHMAGDALLIAVAERLRRVVRETDLTARLGGDEFAILQSGVRSPADSGALAAKLLACLAPPFRIHGSERHISTSIGIALHQDGSPMPEEMMMQADTALYRAKDEGRNRYCFFAPELDQEVRERVSLSEEMRLGFERGELELFYQPQVSQPDGRIVGLEALLRWHHPRRGLLLPQSFMPTAEKSRLLPAINLFVLTTVCRQINEWRAAGVPIVKMAINITFGAFRRPDAFARQVTEVLAEYNVSPPLLDFELSEASLTEPGQDHGIDLQRIQLLGVRLVADRFGDGEMSLNRIGTFGFSRLKISPRLVAGSRGPGRDWTIVRSAIRLADELGLSVVATGVESAEQIHRLVEAGCTIMQGFFLSPPVSPQEAARLLSDGYLRHTWHHTVPHTSPRPAPAPAIHGAAPTPAFDDIPLLLEKLPIAVCVFDTEGGAIVHLNAAFTDLFGYQTHQFATIGAFWQQAIPDPEARSTMLRMSGLGELPDSLANHDLAPAETLVDCADGTTRQIELRPAACDSLRIIAFIDVTAQRSREQQLEILASFDEMTSFLNRRAVLERAETAMRMTLSQHEPLSLIVFDLDRFKSINDTFGHAVGDRVLQILPQAVRSWLRLSDLVGRIGGEEFLVVLPGTDAEGAKLVAERVRGSIHDLKVSTLEGRDVRFTASFGISAMLPGETSMENLIIRADTALYDAKSKGGDMVVVAPTNVQPRAIA